MNEIRRGPATTEFWITIFVEAIAAAVATGLIPTGTTWGQIAAVVLMVAAAMGYQAARAKVKEGL